MDTKTAIVELRSLGYSQAAIADSCGLSQGAISHILTGRRKDVRASTHERIIAALEQARQSPTTTPEPTPTETSHA